MDIQGMGYCSTNEENKQLKEPRLWSVCLRKHLEVLQDKNGLVKNQVAPKPLAGHGFG
jgi:hypothetical protein